MIRPAEWISSRDSPGKSLTAQSEPKFASTWWKQADRLRKEAHVFYFVFKHPRTRWYVKCVAAFPVAYVLSPIQLIPSFIPIIGFLDDFAVLLVGSKLIRVLSPEDLIAECRELADADEIRQQETVRSGIGRFAVLLSAASWLLAAMAASALVAAFIYRW